MNIIFENKDLAVVEKPAGLPSQPDTSGDSDATSLLNAHFAESGERSKAFVVHRLDRTVGGLIVYAKNKETSAVLSKAVAEKDGFLKEYLAVVSGRPENDHGIFKDYIYKDSRAGKAFAVKGERVGAKFASLEYTLLDHLPEKNASLLKIKLNTGRFHQIRVQLASRRMPIFGDGKYGSRERCPSIALWSAHLSFTYKNENFSFDITPDKNKHPWCLFDIQ